MRHTTVRKSTFVPAPRRWSTGFLLPALALAAAIIAGCEASSPARSSAQSRQTAGIEPVRIGIYNSRAVALAFARSEEGQKYVADLHARYQAAVAEGNEAEAQSLREQGEAHQVRLHLQVFGNAPADDAIARIQSDLPNVAQAEHVIAIVPAAQFHDPSIEIVDVTEALVLLFSPTPETLRLARQSREVKPIPIEQAARIPASGG
jgi:hypothetical protein